METMESTMMIAVRWTVFMVIYRGSCVYAYLSGICDKEMMTFFVVCMRSFLFFFVECLFVIVIS